jgi:glycosyltransferase involved in cell wall biosynthesis
VLADITPVILTFNEAPNIGRTLERLTWAREVVIVDSGSTDETLAIARGFPNVRTLIRPFDTHAQQWRYAVEQTGVTSEWVLRLDADYILEPALRDEIAALEPANDVVAYEIAFTYCIDGTPLRGSTYRPQPVLFRPGAVLIEQDGHTEKVRPQGRVVALKGHLLHDDRKSFDRWLQSQIRYQAKEAVKLMERPWSDLDWGDRLRRTRILGAPAVLLYCLFGKGLIFDGMAGLRYTAQRVMADLILSLQLLRRDLGLKPLA